MPRYDVKAITAAVRAEQVIQHLGLEHQRRSSRFYIRCPEPSHADHNIGNCVIRDTGYHCFACGGHGSMIDLVMKIQGTDFVEAVETLADIAGGRQLFIIAGESEHRWSPSTTSIANAGLTTSLPPSASPDIPKVAAIWDQFGAKPILAAAQETANRMRGMTEECRRDGKLGMRIAQLLGDANGVTDKAFAAVKKRCTEMYINAMRETDA